MSQSISSAPPPPTDTFWAFSLDMFPREGVGLACIALQDETGVHVNLLLLACWLAASGRGTLDDADLKRARGISEPWQREVVGPLRDVRRQIKGWPEDASDRPAPDAAAREDYRKKVIGLEVEGERLEQEVLAVAFDRPAEDHPAADRAADAAASLGAYFSQLRIAMDARERGNLATLLGAAFPELDRAAIEALPGINRS